MPNFSSPVLDTNYWSEWEHNIKGGMAGAFYLTDLFLNSTLKDDFLPKEVADTLNPEDINAFFQALADDWQDVVKQNWRILTALAFGILMTLLLPVVGSIWCCCKCCCGSKKKKKEMQLSDDKLLVCLQASFFLFFMMLGWFGMAWYIGSDVVTEMGTQDLPDGLRNAIHDGNLYLNNTVTQGTYLAEVNYDEMTEVFFSELDDGQDRFDAIFQNFTNGTDVNLYQVVDILSFTGDALEIMESGIDQVQNGLDVLNATANNLTESILDIKNSMELEAVIMGLSENSSYDTSEIERLRSNLSGPTSWPQMNLTLFPLPQNETIVIIRELVIELSDALDEIANFSQEITESYIDPFKEAVIQFGDELKYEVSVLVDEVDSISSNNFTQEAIDDMEEVIDDYGTLIFGLVMIPGAVIFIILMLYLMGFIFGTCGKVGGGLRKSGARCLTAGTVIYFLFALIMWLLVTVMFLGGALVQDLGCNTFEDPANSEIYNIFEDNFNQIIQDNLNDSEFASINFSLPEILSDCAASNSIYEVLSLNVLFDVQEFTKWQEYVHLEEVSDNITAVIDDQISFLVNELDTALNDTAIEMLREVTNSSEYLYDFLFAEFDVWNVTDSFDFTVFEEFKEEMERINDTIYNNDTFAYLRQNMESVNDMVSLADSNSQVFLESGNSASSTVSEFKANLTYTPLDLYISDAIELALNMSEDAVKYLNTTTREDILFNLNFTLDSLADLVDQYAYFCTDFVENEFGQCRPFYELYYGMVNTVCWKMLDPYNATWAGFGFLLLFSLPMIYLSCSLSNAFKRQALELRGNHPSSSLVTPTDPLIPLTPDTDRDDIKKGREAFNPHLVEMATPVLLPSDNDVDLNEHKLYDPSDFGYSLKKQDVVYQLPDVYVKESVYPVPEVYKSQISSSPA